MNIFAHFREVIEATLGALADDGALPAGLDFGAITVEPPRDASHGDVATNAMLFYCSSIDIFYDLAFLTEKKGLFFTFYRLFGFDSLWMQGS